MRKFFVSLILLLFPMAMMADSYTSLWKQVSEAQQKDLPKTQIEILDKIISKATLENHYGHLLKAQLMRASAQTIIAPDSMEVFVKQLKEAEVKTSANKHVLAAVYQSVLGRIYRDNRDLGDDASKVSKEYYAKSMSNPYLLATVLATGYEPFVHEEADSKLFHNDLLHVLGFEAEDFKTMHDYYLSHNNRPAACICALKMLQKERYSNDTQMRKSKYMQAIDSLINVYGDLRECGEIAIERYQFMDEAEDVSAEEKMNYINYALNKWGAWPRMNVLRNAQNQLTLPCFNALIGEGVSLPNTPRKVDIYQIVNIQSITMTVTRVNVDGENKLNIDNDQDYAKIKKLLVVDGTQQTVTHRYLGQPNYKVMKDSMMIEGLPVGVYLIEFSTNYNNMKTERALLHVSDMYAVHEFLPNNHVRLVALSATTGLPVPNAKIKLRYANYRGGYDDVNLLTCDKKGEAMYRYDKRQPNRIYVFTDNDKACPETTFHGGFSYYSPKRDFEVFSLFTDRAIYRPGQTVHATLIAYRNVNNKETSVLANKSCKLILRDANHKVVKEQDVITDEYGTASYDFVLPSGGLMGRFSIHSDQSASTYFSVEEYKRPTFQVEFEEMKEKYQNGDTVTVKGKALSYAGVPIQSAKVAVQVIRKQALWWRYYVNEDQHLIMRDTLTTDDEGRFFVKFPVEMPEKLTGNEPQFYNFNVHVDVTDAAGESHQGDFSLPLSNRSTAFTVNMPTQVEVDSIKSVVFNYLNNAGKEIPGQVNYYIDDVKKTNVVDANKSFMMSFNHLKSGKHQLVATCGTDTVKADFIVFSMKDKHPAIETHDWFYQSANEFPRDGKPVYVQMGATDKDQHIVYSIISGKTILESGVIDQSNALTTRQFVYKEEYGDGILLTCAWVRNGKLYAHSAAIRKALPDKKLKMQWTTFRDRLTPGQKEEWTLHIANPDNQPASAQMMAVLYDKSLDDLCRHQWRFSPKLKLSLPYASWQGLLVQSHGVYGELPYKMLNEKALSFSHFDDTLFDLYPVRIMRYGKGRGMLMAASAKMTMARNDVQYDAVEETVVVGSNAVLADTEEAMYLKEVVVKEKNNKDLADGAPASESVQIRENLNETAFFYPALTTDENGDVKISFTLPESVTTWRFMGLSHDKDVNYGMIDGETVAKKTVMVQPNLPRFLRVGDVGLVSARILNTSEQIINGVSEIQLIDPETENIVYRQSQKFVADGGKNTTVTFEVKAQEDYPTLLICRVIANGNGFSDGEQHYLPILPDKEMVTNTYPFVQMGAGTKSIDLDALFPVKDKTNKLTVEYTNNPTWLMIQALPTVASSSDNNVISLASAYYANSIAWNILHQSPDIKKTIAAWKEEKGNETSLESSLQKNQELKTMMLDETPWVNDADHEKDQKSKLINFFDENQVDYRLSENLQKMEKLQNADGSWSWWPGMNGNLHITVATAEMLVRLNNMIGIQENASNMLTKAFKYMGKGILEEVAELKKQEKKNAKNLRPSETAIQWLYLCAIDGRSLPTDVKHGNDYLIDLLAKQTSAFSIYGKAVSAIIFAKNNRMTKAREYLKSIQEYTVYKEEMGRYFDTPKALYSWFDYKIPSQVAAIEAIQMLNSSDEKTIRELQRWLLHSKRTQSWSTPINAVNAVYAFLNGETQQLSALHTTPSTLSVDGQVIDNTKLTAGLGYIKSSLTGERMKEFTAEKTSEGTSWGAVYAQFMQKVSDVKDASAGMKVTRELLNVHEPLKLGDKVRVRITIEADRDYDFVQVTDKRAACLEPIGQLSGYQWGYYRVHKDHATNYYFDRLPKGKHQIESEYYVDRIGTYQTGTCSAQCAYSPEFMAREAGKVLVVK